LGIAQVPRPQTSPDSNPAAGKHWPVRTCRQFFAPIGAPPNQPEKFAGILATWWCRPPPTPLEPTPPPLPCPTHADGPPRGQRVTIWKNRREHGFFLVWGVAKPGLLVVWLSNGERSSGLAESARFWVAIRRSTSSQLIPPAARFEESPFGAGKKSCFNQQGRQASGGNKDLLFHRAKCQPTSICRKSRAKKKKKETARTAPKRAPRFTIASTPSRSHVETRSQSHG